jgi:4-hydroxy-3-polyprenylbenzoate decarboxylase
MADPQRLVVALTGASGVIYGIRLLEVLRDIAGVETHLIVSQAARQTIALETDWQPRDVVALADVTYRVDDIAATISSGSFQTMGMVVVPCSMKTLSSIALSHSDDLIVRAADVTLKERRRLVLVPRETPLHLGHLRLLVQAAEIGAIVVPPMPAFYIRPTSIADIVDHLVLRILDLFSLQAPRPISPRWQGAKLAAARRRAPGGPGGGG